MQLVLIMNLWIFVCSLFGTIYGIRSFFSPKKALYLKMITFGVGCQMFSRLFYVIFHFTQGELWMGFNVGMLGIMGSFLFFLCANYGQMDGLVDDGSKAFRKTRLLSLIVPTLILIMYIIFFLLTKDISISARISVGILTLIMMPCSYFNFKHFIIYDVAFGIIRPLRKYNILAVVYAFLTMLEFYGIYLNITPLYIASCVGIGAVSAAILPVLKGGAGKWKKSNS